MYMGLNSADFSPWPSWPSTCNIDCSIFDKHSNSAYCRCLMWGHLILSLYLSLGEGAYAMAALPLMLQGKRVLVLFLSRVFLQIVA